MMKMQSHSEYTVPPSLITLFHQQAAQKIHSERWKGRNTEVKIQNFVRCWATEEAFKQLLIRNGCWFRYRGLYFGDAAGAGADFTVKIKGKEISLGLRSIAADSLKWKSVAYPDDRFREEKENEKKDERKEGGGKGKIADYHVACIVQDALEGEGQEKKEWRINKGECMVTFLGIIPKAELLSALENSSRKYSKKNQEYFRVIPLEKFSGERLKELFGVLDRA